MLEILATFLLQTTLDIGYVGILIAMFLVFSFFPLPSQLVLIPAGYLAHTGELNLFWILIFGSIGGMLGAHFNYILAHKFGKDFVLKYGHYFFISQKAILKTEEFFEKHGAFSISIALITPGIGQLASLPAGFANMNKKIFFFSSLFGSVAWNAMMVFSGYFFGEYQEWIFNHIAMIFVFLFLLMVFIASIYFFYHYRKNK